MTAGLMYRQYRPLLPKLLCKQKCLDYKVKLPAGPGARRYTDEVKRCTRCEVFIKYDGNRCPCCHMCLKHKSRNPRYRERPRVVVKYVPVERGINGLKL